MTDWPRIYRVLFAYIDAVITFVSGVGILLAPDASYATSFPTLARGSATTLMTREFGMMCILLGMVAWPVMTSGRVPLMRRVLCALLVGDVLHLIVLVPACAATDWQKPMLVFNAAYTAAIAVTRSIVIVRSRTV